MRLSISTGAFCNKGRRRAALPFDGTTASPLITCSYGLIYDAIKRWRDDDAEEETAMADHHGRYDDANYAFLLRCYGDAQALPHLRNLHARLLAEGRLRSSTYLANLAIQGYGKCGLAEEARGVFDGIHLPDRFSWNLMITAYAQNGRPKEALQLYNQMLTKGTQIPDKCTFLAVLSACASLRALSEGKKAHEFALRTGLLNSDITLKTALVTMYAKCGSLVDACAIFNTMSDGVCDRIAWNAMITANAQHGHMEEALQLSQKMELLQGLKPDASIFLCLINACVNSKSLHYGRIVHQGIVAQGLLDSETCVQNALLNMYGKCGNIKEAQAIFDGMRRRDLISWNSMIATYAQNGCGKEALDTFRQMELEGVTPNKITYIFLLNVAASLGSLQYGREIRKHINARGFESDAMVRTALVNMYGKCGDLYEAWTLFKGTRQRDVISWSTMITVCVQNDHCKEAIELFLEMDLQGVKPDKVAFVCLVNACTSLASLEHGRVIHECLAGSEFEFDITVANALLNLYAKCGSFKDAQFFFEGMHQRDVISWNTMLVAYAQNGLGKEALELFQRMDIERVKPYTATFVCLLNACSHAGLPDEGWHLLISMGNDYGMTPIEEHYACMVDILGRSSYLIEAEDMAKNMPVQSDVVAWVALLGAC